MPHANIGVQCEVFNSSVAVCDGGHSLGYRLPQERKFSRRSSNSWRTALGIRERGSCLCGQLALRHRRLRREEIKKQKGKRERK